ncbi:hypothetical protein B1748_10375 [Paenibacillus sp. MY03]|jgi:hypothetical protein|nr:hypothetical protein B1748_10375 [Paenibacillus sp. MY03]
MISLAFYSEYQACSVTVAIVSQLGQSSDWIITDDYCGFFDPYNDRKVSELKKSWETLCEGAVLDEDEAIRKAMDSFELPGEQFAILRQISTVS